MPFSCIFTNQTATLLLTMLIFMTTPRCWLEGRLPTRRTDPQMSLPLASCNFRTHHENVSNRLFSPTSFLRWLFALLKQNWRHAHCGRVFSAKIDTISFNVCVVRWVLSAICGSWNSADE